MNGDLILELIFCCLFKVDKMARLALIFLMLEEAHRMDLRKRRNSRRIARYADKAMHLSEDGFKANYRITKSMFKELCRELEPLMSVPKRRSDINTKSKILVALSFFATGRYQRTVATSSGAPMAQQTASRAIREVVTALNRPEMLQNYIKFPQTRQERNKIKEGFFTKCGIPGLVGCIDGTHVPIVRPSENDDRYLNSKQFHSRNVLIICDADLNILSVDASFGGASHDSVVWNQHPVKNHLVQLNNSGEIACLLGDSEYEQREYMMTPIVDATADSPEEHYNKLHTTARNTVERTIAVLKNRWRCLSGEKVLHYTPDVAANIIKACCVLHNFCNRLGLDAEHYDNSTEETLSDDELDATQNLRGSSVELQRGIAARAKLIRQLWAAR